MKPSREIMRRKTNWQCLNHYWEGNRNQKKKKGNRKPLKTTWKVCVLSPPVERTVTYGTDTMNGEDTASLSSLLREQDVAFEQPNLK